MQQNAVQTPWARDLRQHPSAAEWLLWDALRDRRFMRLKFRRPAPLRPLIVDFLCTECRLIVETTDKPNAARNRWLTERGYQRVTINDHDVLSDLAGQLLQLAATLNCSRFCSDSE